MTDITLETIKRMSDHLPVEDQLSLVEYVARNLRQIRERHNAAVEGPVVATKPQSLRGVWKDHFPADLDIDAILHDIRHEWEKELDEVSGE